MPKFEITAKSDINTNGCNVYRGQSFQIEINMGGIFPSNLFGNSRCADTLRRQLALHDIDVAPNSPALIGGKWDIKMVK